MTIRLRTRLISIVILVLLSALALTLVLRATPEGLTLSDDSIAYIAGARSMLAGDGYREAWLASNGPVTHFPPAYPASLVVLGWVGLDPLRGARFLGAVLFALNTGLLGILGWRMTRSLPAGIALAALFSGDGGWNLGVIPMARRLQAEGALVVGVDIRAFLASLERSGACAYPAGNLEELSRAVQLRHRLPEYRAPILVGDSSGATLVYAALAQAPPETFRGAISLGFCPDVSLRTPVCRGRGLVSRPMAKGPGRDLDPLREMGVPWTVLHGEIDQVCAPAVAADFVGRVDSGRLVSLPKVGHGFSVTSRWEPQYVEEYRRMAAETTPAPPASPTGVAAGATDDPSWMRRRSRCRHA